MTPEKIRDTAMRCMGPNNVHIEQKAAEEEIERWMEDQCETLTHKSNIGKLRSMLGRSFIFGLKCGVRDVPIDDVKRFYNEVIK